MRSSSDEIFKQSVDVYNVSNNMDPIPCCVLLIFALSKLDEYELQTKKKSGSRQACNGSNWLKLWKSIMSFPPDNSRP